MESRKMNETMWQRVFIIVAISLLALPVYSVTFTENTLIDANDLTYDGQDIVIDGCTLTVNGKHTFNSLELMNEAVVTHSPAPNGEIDHRLDLQIEMDVVIPAGCGIVASGKGYKPGSGRGSSSGAAGYGGKGGSSSSASGSSIYGSINEPNEHGSGGQSYGRTGGCGGGLIKVSVNGVLYNLGKIAADGETGSYWRQSNCIGPGCDTASGFAGSGGSILVKALSLAGSGVLSVNGGYAPGTTAGGGGGRIAIYYQNLADFSGTITANGGRNNTYYHYSGDDGTVFLHQIDSQCIIYVDDDATGANDGSSWENAYRHLQDALAAVEAGDEVRIAQGAYTPDRGSDVDRGDRHASFVLISDVAYKGGFAGLGAVDPNVRDVNEYPTFLTGDLRNNDADISDPSLLLMDDTRKDNSLCVVYAEYLSYNTIMEGFIITRGNHEAGSGAGMYIYSKWGQPTITDCVFEHNAASKEGGALYSHCYPTIQECHFVNNRSSSSGGGLYILDQITLMNCQFYQNSAGVTGGGVYANAGLIAEGCEFIGNSSHTQGGGLYSKSGNLDFYNCKLSDNYAETDGGGIYTDSGILDVNKCEIVNNIASKNGGALAFSNGVMSLYHSNLSSNISRLGGGIYINTTTDESILSNCLVTGNSANYGGAMYGSKCEARIINCTLADNDTSQGFTLQFTDPSDRIMITSTILWNGKNEILQNDISYVWVSYSNVDGGWDWPGEYNIDVDPVFVNPGYWGDLNDASIVLEPTNPNAIWIQGDYHLQSESPCINTGDIDFAADPNHAVLDFYEGERLVGARVDMGADEYDPGQSGN